MPGGKNPNCPKSLYITGISYNGFPLVWQENFCYKSESKASNHAATIRFLSYNTHSCDTIPSADRGNLGPYFTGCCLDMNQGIFWVCVLLLELRISIKKLSVSHLLFTVSYLPLQISPFLGMGELFFETELTNHRLLCLHHSP